jgi:hypothetical protein
LSVDPRIRYVEDTIGFRFEQGFARRYEEVGSPVEDLEIWYRNALVYAKVTKNRPPRDSQRLRLVILIEAIRFEATHPPFPDEPGEFDISSYEFSEDVLSYKSAVIEEVLRQEA